MNQRLQMPAATKAIETFQFKGAPIRTAGTFDAPLFCAADVCAVLEIVDAVKAVNRLDQEDVINIDDQAKNGCERALVLGPNANVYLTESGLYTLILTSRKPQAKAFKRWVTGEVLPSIRKRGYYSAVEAEIEKYTAKLLAEHFPLLPGKATPEFRSLIEALVRKFGWAPSSSKKVEARGRKVPWGPILASLIYSWAFPIPGQQQHRREKNPKPNGSSVDFSMLSPEALETLRDVLKTGERYVKTSSTWELWKTNMELVFGTKALQMPIMVPFAFLPEGAGK
jgi:prophage antirepressor-like protein